MSTTVDNNSTFVMTMIQIAVGPVVFTTVSFSSWQTGRADNGTGNAHRANNPFAAPAPELWELLQSLHFMNSKPSETVTKEEIENSGLEVITTQKLEQYAKEEKVTSSCTEQCIICLEEYKGEDEVRVMKCKHAFHRRCIDNWLETGRNNCPACRTECIKLSNEAEAGAV